MTERENSLEQEARKELRKKKLSEIEPIEESHIRIVNKGDLAKVVEGPLLAACESLFDKNIQTNMSTANKKNVEAGNPADFSVDYDALSDKNKEVAAKLIEEGIARLYPAVSKHYNAILSMSIPLKADVTWGEVEDVSMQIANRFHRQRYMPQAVSPEFLMKHLEYAINEDIEGDTVPPEYFERHGYFFDRNSGLFFTSKEDIQRAYEPVEGEDPNEPPNFSKVL